MTGAICGDVFGSAYEYANTNNRAFEFPTKGTRYTDDSLLTIATMDALLRGDDFGKAYVKWYNIEPSQDFGARFRSWAAAGGKEPYNSLGNGSAMRVSPAGWWYDTADETVAAAEASAKCSHGHPEGIKAAAVTAWSVFVARKYTPGNPQAKQLIRRYAEQRGYDLSDIDRLVRYTPKVSTWETAPVTMPVALAAFLKGNSWEECVRYAVAAGGDSDTIAAITGAIAEAHYGRGPQPIQEECLSLLPKTYLTLIEAFMAEVSRRLRTPLRK